MQVLPYLKDEVMMLPEEGASLRNKYANCSLRNKYANCYSKQMRGPV